MNAILITLVLAAAIAALVILDVKPWRRFVLTVTITADTADTAAFDAAMARVMESARQFSDSLARASSPETERPDGEAGPGGVVPSPQRLSSPRATVSPHTHTTFVPGCYRCDLSRDEAMHAAASEWVWCSEVWAVLTNDGCAMDYRHESDCPCENRYPLAIAAEEYEPGYLKARGVVGGTEPAEHIIRRMRDGRPMAERERDWTAPPPEGIRGLLAEQSAGTGDGQPSRVRVHHITIEFTAPQWVADIAFDTFADLAHDSMSYCDPSVSMTSGDDP